VDAVEPEAGIGLLSASLLAVLFAVKVIAALARKASSASPLVRAHWEWRRNLARYYDSYQWRKLVWFGIGILIGGAVDWPGTSAQWTLGVGCVAAGGVAEIFWRRHRLGLVPQGV
jgi:hypothetical protein